MHTEVKRVETLHEAQTLPSPKADRSVRRRWDRWSRRGGRKKKCAPSRVRRFPIPRWGLRKGILRGAKPEDLDNVGDKAAHEGAPEEEEEDTGAYSADDRSSLPQHCLLMATLHYVVSGSIGVKAKVMHPTPVVIDTGSGYNVIRRSALPDNWQDYITVDRALPRLGDANGNALSVCHEVLLRVRFGNALYRVPFLVVENLSCPVLLGTRFANRHIEAIWCRRGKVEFTQDVLPIIGTGKKLIPWESHRSTEHERATLRGGKSASIGDETATLTRIRLIERVVIPASTQVRAHVSTLLQGLIVTEPKHDLSRRYGVRVMNSVHEVTANEPFDILVSNFSRRDVFLPKGMVIAYASRSPLALINLEGGAAQEILGMHSIFLTTSDDKEEAATDAPNTDLPKTTGELRKKNSASEVALQSDNPKSGCEGKKPATMDIDPIPVRDMPIVGDMKSGAQESAPDDDERDWREKIDLKHLKDAKFQKKVMNMLEGYKKVFEGKLGQIRATEHRIELKSDTNPVNLPPYRAGPAKREEIRKQIEYQLEAGVIEPAQTEWASPVLLAPKKDGKMRFCVDFRRLNAATIPDTYPLPRMDDCIDSLSEAKVFTLLDALWGYWQVPIAEKDKDKTTFTSHMGTFRYTRMPFGLRNAPSTFQRALDIVLSGVRWRIVLSTLMI